MHSTNGGLFDIYYSLLYSAHHIHQNKGSLYIQNCDLEQELTRLSDTALAEYDCFVEPIAVLEACLWAVVQLRLLRDRHGQVGRRDLSSSQSILQSLTAEKKVGVCKQ